MIVFFPKPQKSEPKRGDWVLESAKGEIGENKGTVKVQIFVEWIEDFSLVIVN